MKVLIKLLKLCCFFFFWVYFVIGCQDKKSPVFSEEPILIEENYKPMFKILTWKDGKKAAYTLSFDDARESHYKVAWPELQKRGIVGTFNINTPDDLNWIPWKYLAEFGNEIASHTVNHVDLTSLTPEQIEYELKESFNRIKKNINRAPSSFSHPYGLTNAFVEDIISKYYLSARCDFGINSNRLTENEFYHLEGIGIYPAIKRHFLQQIIQKTIAEEGYLIVTFHSIIHSDSIAIDKTYMPLDFFQQHLDDVVGYSNDFWIATRADIIKYLRLRQNANLVFTQTSSQLTCKLKSNLDPQVYDFPLSIKIVLPHNWKNKKIVNFSKAIKSFTVKSNVDSIYTFNILNNQEIFLKAF